MSLLKDGIFDKHNKEVGWVLGTPSGPGSWAAVPLYLDRSVRTVIIKRVPRVS